jgi:hypothetical protein
MGLTRCRSVFDNIGNLVGAAAIGGGGHGTIFQLSPPATLGGDWDETTLKIFHRVPDGAFPECRSGRYFHGSAGRNNFSGGVNNQDGIRIDPAHKAKWNLKNKCFMTLEAFQKTPPIPTSDYWQGTSIRCG